MGPTFRTNRPGRLQPSSGEGEGKVDPSLGNLNQGSGIGGAIGGGRAPAGYITPIHIGENGVPASACLGLIRVRGLESGAGIRGGVRRRVRRGVRARFGKRESAFETCPF